MRKEIFEITRIQQYTDSQLVPMQIGVRPKSIGKGKDSKDTKDAENESSKKVKVDDLRKSHYCQKTGHVKSGCKSRLRDLADAGEKPSDCKLRLSSTAAVAPLADDHATTFLVTVPRVERKTSCACVKVETTMRSDAGSTSPTGTELVKLISAVPTCETCWMRDTCAGEGICLRGSDQTVQNDTTVVSM